MPLLALLLAVFGAGMTFVGTMAQPDPADPADCGVVATDSDGCIEPEDAGPATPEPACFQQGCSGEVPAPEATDPAETMAVDLDAALLACAEENGIASCTGADLVRDHPEFETALSTPCTEPGGACITYDRDGEASWDIIVRGTGAMESIAYRMARPVPQEDSVFSCVDAADADSIDPKPIDCPAVQAAGSSS